MNSKLLFFVIFSVFVFTGVFSSPLSLEPSSHAGLVGRKNGIEVANNTHISYDGLTIKVQPPEGELKIYDSSKSAHSKKAYGGWVASYWFIKSAGFTIFEASWVVPATPIISTGQQLVFVNSFEDTTQTIAIQSVLQYNNIISGWSVSSWYLVGTSQFYTTPHSVKPGQTITGIVEVTNKGGILYSYVVVDRTIIASSLQVNSTATTYPYAQIGVEAYNTYTCLQYPPGNSITFEVNVIDAVDSSKPVVYNTTCDEYASLISPYVVLGWDS